MELCSITTIQASRQGKGENTRKGKKNKQTNDDSTYIFRIAIKKVNRLIDDKS